MTQMAALITAGLLLFLFESLIPRPLPWAKPGFSQIVTLIALYLWGWREAMVVVAARVSLAALIAGSFAGPVFWIALPAGIGAALIMAGCRALAGERLSIIGISMIGALTHNLLQLMAAWLLLVQQPQIFYLFPLLWLPAIVTGIMTGWIAHASLTLLHRVSPSRGTNRA